MSYEKEKICRTCLGESDLLYSLYDQYVDENGQQNSLITILKKVCGEVISVELTDAKVCADCLQKIFLSYEFILKIEQVEADLVERSQVVPLQLRAATNDLTMGMEDALDEKLIDEINDEQADFEYLDEEFQTNDDNFIKIETNDEESDTEIEQTTLDKSDGSNNFESAKCDSSFEDEDSIIDQNDTEPTDTPEKKNKKNLVTLANIKEPKIGSRLGKGSSKRKLNCKKCSRTFAKAETLYKHIRKAHTYLEVDPTELQSEPSLLQCSHCPRIFKRKENLNRHLITVHAAEVNVAEIKKKMAKKGHTYKRGLCPHCGESFSQASLIVHIRRHTGENPYKCQECGKGFPRRQDLTIHERQHTGEKPHVCNVCGKSFIRPNKLTRHMRIHTGDRPYACDRCNKRFVQSNDLKIHLRRHTGEKPYKCGVCGQGFICGALLKAHRNATSHHLPTDNLVDPYATVRVVNRTNVSLEEIEVAKC